MQNSIDRSSAQQRRVRRAIWSWLSYLLVFSVVTIYAHLPRITGNRALERYTPPFSLAPSITDPLHLGAEIFNVGQSIYERGEYADAFWVGSGPTAWVAPTLPMLVAALLVLTGGSKFAVAMIFMVLQIVILAWTARHVVSFARSQGSAMAGFVAIFAIALCDFYYLFQITHDCVLLSAVVTAIVLMGSACERAFGSPKGLIAWGTLGGIAWLSSPIIGLTWTMVYVIRLPPLGWSRLAVPVLIAGCFISPWVVRNRVVLGAWIPIKSNGGFESYQALVVEPEGLFSQTAMRGHPYRNPYSTLGRRYAEVGEVVFVAEKKEAFWQSLCHEPWKYLDDLSNRLSAATFELRDAFNVVELSTFHRFASWWYPLPFLGFIASILFPPTRNRRVLVTCQIVFVSYLLPYVLISFYARYAVPLLFVRAVFAAYLVALLARLLRAALGRSCEKKTSSVQRG